MKHNSQLLVTFKNFGRNQKYNFMWGNESEGNILINYFTCINKKSYSYIQWWYSEFSYKQIDIYQA